MGFSNSKTTSNSRQPMRMVRKHEDTIVSELFHVSIWSPPEGATPFAVVEHL